MTETEIFYHPWSHQFLVRAVPDEDALIISQIETERARIDTLQASKDAEVASLHTRIDVTSENAMGTIGVVNASVVALEALTSGFTASIAQLQAAVVALQS
jgi:hypothetical protein